jgi:cytochrome c
MTATPEITPCGLVDGGQGRRAPTGDAAHLYTQKCQVCHQTHGNSQMMPNMSFRRRPSGSTAPRSL